MPKPQKSVSDRLHLQADVLILGGGPSAAWAAVAAAESGAKVVLADKGYL
ncbi:MAG: FAD-dependent oxidoreductase, partial [Mesorhizobium sp.]